MTLMLLTPLFLKILWTWSREYPATTWPLTWRIWSPNLSPARAAGDPLVTRQTNTPLLMAATRSPTRPSASLHRISCNKHSLFSALKKYRYKRPRKQHLLSYRKLIEGLLYGSSEWTEQYKNTNKSLFNLKFTITATKLMRFII